MSRLGTSCPVLWFVSAHAVDEWRTSLATVHLPPHPDRRMPLHHHHHHYHHRSACKEPHAFVCDLESRVPCAPCLTSIKPSATAHTRSRGSRASQTSTALTLKQAKADHVIHDEVLQTSVLLGYYNHLRFAHFSRPQTGSSPEND
jgi:hypothetical protein